MINIALASFITGAAKAKSVEIDEDTRAKREADSMAIKRIIDMEDYGTKLNMATEAKTKAAKADYELKSQAFNDLIRKSGGAVGEDGSIQADSQAYDIAKTYYMDGNEGKAAEILAQPNMYNAKNTKDTNIVEQDKFTKQNDVQFTDGTMKTVRDNFTALVEAGGINSPIKSQSPASRIQGLDMFETLTDQLIAPYKSSGRVGHISASTLSNIASETVKTINGVKEFINVDDPASTQQKLADLDSIIPELQRAYDPTGANDFNLFDNRRLFNREQLMFINDAIKKNPDKYPNLASDIPEIQTGMQNKEALQSKGMVKPESTLSPASTAPAIDSSGYLRKPLVNLTPSNKYEM